MTDVAIIGAGPYGLSIAAHLRARGVAFRIFGQPMRTWRENMPEGMRLKSEGFASSLYDSESVFTLKDYCQGQGIAYGDVGLPVRLDTFIAYGLEFQKKFVPELEEKRVVALRRTPQGFTMEMDDGTTASSKKVVIAVGLTYFAHLPSIFSEVSEQFVTHSARHNGLKGFEGKEVIVVGAGASALDLAALLNESGADARLVARASAIRFHDPPAQSPRPFLERLRYPMTGIGMGWPVFFCANAPLMFRCLPEQRRLDAVQRILGPAPGWFIREQISNKVPFTLGVDITGARASSGRITLELTGRGNGQKTTVTADHVIAATGYRVDLARIGLLDASIQASIERAGAGPALSSNFESSIPGLYFVGTAAANTFGPLLRFAFGAGFVAPRISKHLSATTGRKFSARRSSGEDVGGEKDNSAPIARVTNA